MKILKKLLIITLIAYASLFAMVSPALAQIPEDSTMEITIFEDESFVVYDNTTDVIDFTINSTDEDEIINIISDRVNATADEVEAVSTFQSGTNDTETEDMEIVALIDEESDSTEITVFENGTQVDNFIVDASGEPTIISNVATILGMSEDEIESVITFEEVTDGDNQIDINNSQIDVLINEEEGTSDVTVTENGSQVDNFTIDSTDMDEITQEVSTILNISQEDVENIIAFEMIDEPTDDGDGAIGDNATENQSINNLQIMIMINDNENITQVTVFEEGSQINSFTIDSTESDNIINELSQRYDASEDDVVNAIVEEIEVETTVGEWSLFVFFDKFVQLFNIIESNIYEDNEFNSNMNSVSGRVLSDDVNYSDVNSTIQVAVDYEKWTMYKFFRMMASPNGLLIGAEIEGNMNNMTNESSS